MAGYSVSEDRKIYSPYGQQYVVYLPKNEVKIWIWGAWRIFNIDKLYEQAWQ